MTSAQEKRVQRRARRTISTARRRVSPGKSSDFIHNLDDFELDGRPCILYARVSARSQGANGHLNSQINYELRELKKMKITPVAVFKEVSSGWNQEREQLSSAIAYAREIGGFVIARCVDRFIRSEDFHSVRAPNAVPSVIEYSMLMAGTWDVPLVTRLHPDTPGSEAHSEAIKCGQSATRKKVGRKKTRRGSYQERATDETKRQAKELREEGTSFRDIANEGGFAPSTVSGWF